jgi:4-amino-4-deoxy-L-arabinose transferase-like glycosyltransferase
MKYSAEWRRTRKVTRMLNTTDEPPVASAPSRRARRLGLTWLPPHRAALTLIAALAAAAYTWGMGSDVLHPYYEASVRSMSTNAHNFLYGAFDPAGTITLDKLPGALWVQAVFVAVFGFHTWAMVLPQAIEGVLAVVFLYRAVARMAGPTAGVVAAAVLAASPAVVSLDRGNINDSLMILLLVLAADATSAAVRSGASRSLVLAGVWVGLAFQAKMLQAWLVLPALALAYLLGGPGAIMRRLRQLGLAGMVTGAVSLSWMVLVSLTPSSGRPFVDGSTDDSWFQQVFVYNGLNRLGGQTPTQTLASQGIGESFALSQPVSPWRLFVGYLGRDAGWLLLAAVVVVLVVLVGRRRQPRTDPVRASLILWASWLAVLGVVFSVSTSTNPYYTAALAPAVAAIIGIGVAAAVSSGHRLAPLVTGVIVIVSVTYAVWLLADADTAAPQWVRPTSIAVGLAALATVALALLRRRRGTLAATLVAGLVATCFTPTVAAVSIVASHEGAFDTPFESDDVSAAIDRTFVLTPAQVAGAVPSLEQGRRGAPYLLATQTSALASLFLDATSDEVLPIGGFDGATPSPTLAQIEADVCQGQFHVAFIADGPDPRLHWIAQHCASAGIVTGSGLQYYDCEPPAGC